MPKVGRPLKFKTVEELQEAIDEYFTNCDNRLIQGYDEKTNQQFAYISPEPYTMHGLAYSLDLSRKQLLVYKRRYQFGNAIIKARRKVAMDVERRMMEGKGATAGAIFSLKNNFGWKDESRVDHTTKGKELPVPILGAIHTNDSHKEAGETPEAD